MQLSTVQHWQSANLDLTLTLAKPRHDTSKQTRRLKATRPKTNAQSLLFPAFFNTVPFFTVLSVMFFERLLVLLYLFAAARLHPNTVRLFPLDQRDI
jgi:hypothetical protein